MANATVGKSTLATLFGGNSDSSDEDDVGGLFFFGIMDEEDEEEPSRDNATSVPASSPSHIPPDESLTLVPDATSQTQKGTIREVDPHRRAYKKAGLNTLVSRRRSHLHAPSRAEVAEMQVRSGGARREEEALNAETAGLMQILRELDNVLRSFPPAPTHSVLVDDILTASSTSEGTNPAHSDAAKPAASPASAGTSSGLTSAMRSLFGAATKRW